MGGRRRLTEGQKKLLLAAAALAAVAIASVALEIVRMAVLP